MEQIRQLSPGPFVPAFHLPKFYVSNPVCSPSRTAFMTGHFPAQHPVHQHFATHRQNAERGMPDWLDPDATTVCDLLKKAGYTTARGQIIQPSSEPRIGLKLWSLEARISVRPSVRILCPNAVIGLGMHRSGEDGN